MNKEEQQEYAELTPHKENLVPVKLKIGVVCGSQIQTQ